jgi:hypothetical protein
MCLLILAVVGAAAVVSMHYGISWNAFFKGLEFIGFTSFTFGGWIANRRRRWRDKSFWSFTALVLMAHTVGYLLLLSRVEVFKPVWFAMIAFAEFVFLVLCSDWIIPQVQRKPQSVHPHGR